MQANLHPEVYTDVSVSCSGCGNKFSITSAKQDAMVIELCHCCHPAYTGKRKVSTAGAIEKFSQKFGSAFDSMVSDNDSN